MAVPSSVPAPARVALERARELVQEGVPSLAEAQFRSAIAIAPRWGLARREFARFLAAQNRPSEAAVAWRDLLKLAPTDPEARNGLLAAQRAMPGSAQPRTQASAQAEPPRVAQTPKNGTPNATVPTRPATPPRLSVAPAPVATPKATMTPKAMATPKAAVSPRPTPRPAIAPGTTATPRLTPRVSATPQATPRTNAVATPRVAPQASVNRQPSRAPLNLSFAAPAKVGRKRAARAFPPVNEGARLLGLKRTEEALAAYQRAYELNPYNEYAANGIGTSLLILGRFDEAAQAFARALLVLPQTSDERPRAERGLADTLTYGTRYQQAIDANNAILAHQPNDFASLYQLAQINTFTKRYPQASAFYQRALNVAPQSQRGEVLAAFGEALTYGGQTARANEVLGEALQIAPNATRTRRALANLALYSGSYRNAVVAYRAVLLKNPGDVAALLGLADALTFSGQSGLAIARYRQALAIAPSSRAQLGLGRALIASRRFREALPELQRARASEPDNRETRQLLAIAQSETGDVAGALNVYRSLLTANAAPAQRADTLLSIGDLQARQSNFPSANYAYAKAFALDPQNSEIGLRYANFLLGQRRFDEARQVTRAVLNRAPGSLRGRVLELAVESRAGNVQRAQALARQLTDAQPESFDDALILVSALRDAGENEASQRLLARLVAQNGNGNPGQRLRLAQTARDVGEFATAAQLFRAYLLQNPKDATARLGLAETLAYQRDYTSAAQEIARVVAAEPDNERARDLQARIASFRGTPETLAQAETVYRRALAKNPNDPRALAGLGFVLSARSDFAGAVAQYQAALNADPNDVPTRLGLARNLYYARRADDAIAQYDEILRRTPDDNAVRFELAQIFLDRNRLDDAERLYAGILQAANAVDNDASATSAITATPSARSSFDLRLPAPNGDMVTFSPPQSVNPSVALPKLTARSSRHRVGMRRVSLRSDSLRVAQAGGVASGSNSTSQVGGSAPESPGATQGAAGAPNVAPGTNATTETDNANTNTNTTNGATTATPPAIPQLPTTAAPIPPDNGNGAPPPTTASPEDQVRATRGLAEVRRRQGRFAEAIDLFRQVLSVDASDVAARLGLAQSLRGSGDFVTALTETESVLGRDPQSLSGRVLRAQLLADTGRTAEAQTELNTLAQGLTNASLENYLSVAEALAGLRSYDSAVRVLQAGESAFPGELLLPLRRGDVLLASGDFDAARELFEQIIAANPREFDARLGRARSFNYSNRLLEADAAYREALQLEPRSFAGRIELADILSRRGDYPQSIDLYQQAIADNPGDLAARVQFARVLRFNRRFADSGRALDQVLQADARNVPALIERGILRGQVGDYQPGIADLQQALQLAPDDLNAQLGLAEVLSYQGNYPESIRLYRAALERAPENEKARTELGLALSYAGQNEEALRQIETVLRANPNSTDAQIARASTLGRARRFDESIALFRAILRRDPKSQRAQLGLAESLVAAGQFPQAVAAYDVLLRTEPDNASYRVARAQALGYAGRTNEAVSALQAVLQSNPNNERARLALAETLTNSGNRSLRAAAIRQYRSILVRQPSNVAARFGLGRALSYQGDFGSAQRELNTVLDTQPRNTEALFELAQAQRFSNDPFAARDTYRRLLQVDPRSARARAGLRLTERATLPDVTAFARRYTDTNGVRFTTFGIGPTLRTRAGNIGASVETGNFRDAGTNLRRNAINLLLSRARGPLEARLLLSGVHYDNTDESGTRFLYDLFLQRVKKDGRQRVYLNIAQREVIESFGAVNFDIRARNYGIGFAQPLGRFDLEGSAARLNYSDSNKRNILTAALLYRVSDDINRRGVFRVGVGQRYDSTRFQPAIFRNEPLYYAPDGFSATSILADYQLNNGRLRTGLFAAYPLTNSTGRNNVNRPAKTLFGYANYQLTDLIELFANGGIVRSPDFDSNDITGGITFRLK